MLAIGILAPALWVHTAMQSSQFTDLVITKDTVLTASDVVRRRIVIKADNVTLDGSGLTLSGPGYRGDLEALENAGVGIEANGVTNVTIRNLTVRGFAIGLGMKDSRAVVVESCDFSDNYHNPAHGWGDLPPRGGIILENVTLGVFRNNRANRVWDALSLTKSHDNLFLDNDFSHTSNTCAKLWESSRNKFLGNNLSYGIRIDREGGEVHARDSTSVLIETDSHDNYFYRNDITHGGDGVFIRVLNGWTSERNIFVENDTSFANNNCIEAWSPNNTYVRNRADRGSYGFWLGGSDHSVLIGNSISYNGLKTGYQNAPLEEAGNGGIFVANFGASHVEILGNDIRGNAGAGIAFRGNPREFRIFDWLIQQNVLEGNKIGIYGRYGDFIYSSANRFAGNEKDLDIAETLNFRESPEAEPGRAPMAELIAPKIADIGEEIVLDASLSADPEGRPLTYTWRVGDEELSGAVLRKTFTKPGFYRVALIVSNGALSAQASHDLIVSEGVVDELGTEGKAAEWSGLQEGSTAPVVFTNDSDAVVGRRSVRVSLPQYAGDDVTATLRAGSTGWNLSGKKSLVIWMKALNQNNQGFQDSGPAFTLRSANGSVTLNPVKDRHLFQWFNPNSEARYHWLRIEVPLEGSDFWVRQTEGSFDPRRVKSVDITLDSYGLDPFTFWLDGLRFE